MVAEKEAKVKIEAVAWRAGGYITELSIKTGDTLRHVLNCWASLNPDIARVAYNTEEEKLTGVMVVVLNNMLEHDLDVKLKDGDVIELVPLIDGG